MISISKLNNLLFYSRQISVHLNKSVMSKFKQRLVIAIIAHLHVFLCSKIQGTK